MTSLPKGPAVAPDFILCSFDGCERPAKEDGLCWGHVKQRRRGQRLTPLRDDTRTPSELLADAAQRYVDAEGDEEYARARQLLHRTAINFTHRLAPHELLSAVGVKVGRPRVMSDEEVKEAVRAAGSVRGAARALGVTRAAVQIRLRAMEGARKFLAGGHSSTPKGRF